MTGMNESRNQDSMRGVFIGERVSRPRATFKDRQEAGRHLAAMLEVEQAGAEAIVLGLPRGGIVVGKGVAERLGVPLKPCFVRKLPIPWSPEMGFGAIGLDGTVVLNERLVSSLGLSKDDMKSIIDEVSVENRRRAARYGEQAAVQDVENKQVYIVDDGLATGYTAMAAVQMMRRHEPKCIIVCVPVAPWTSLSLLKQLTDAIYCLIQQDQGGFAVASYYQDFHELTDKEVFDVLNCQMRQ